MVRREVDAKERSADDAIDVMTYGGPPVEDGARSRMPVLIWQSSQGP